MVDACEWEQSALLQRYVLEKSKELEQLASVEASAAGPCSLSPFVPCATSRIPYILQAARITGDDVLYDLGCGDGIVLHEAASRRGCKCVGLDIDAPCVELARARAQERGVADLCLWGQCDLLRLPPGALGGSVQEAVGDIVRGGDCSLEAPTVALVFVTSSGLVKLAPWLHHEWRNSPRGLRLVTCVESLDTAVDYNDPAGMFADANALGWPVCHDHAKWGVFVVPPYGVSVPSWSLGRLPLEFSRAEADLTRPLVLEGLLSPEEVQLVDRIGQQQLSEQGAAENSSMSLFDVSEEHFHAAAEDVLHSLTEHRVLHLHGVQTLADEACGLPAIERKLVDAMHTHDDWGLLAARVVNVRSLEYHTYASGGSVLDPEHRDDGSLLTLSVLLSSPQSFEGGAFITWQSGTRVVHHLDQGDGILFVSEKRHNVETVKGDRRALILELWEGPRNTRNRHL